MLDVGRNQHGVGRERMGGDCRVEVLDSLTVAFQR